MNSSNPNLEYEAKVIITFAPPAPPPPPTGLHVVGQGSNPAAPAPVLSDPPPSKPTGGYLSYFKLSNGQPVQGTPQLTGNDPIKFSLWYQVTANTVPDPLNPPPIAVHGDLVLIAQYDSDAADPQKKPRGRRSPFKAGELALALEEGKPNDWTFNVINLEHAAGISNFEYSVMALLRTGATKVFVDPSIIIKPQ